MQVGLAHEGFRTIIINIEQKITKYHLCCMRAPLNNYFILFLILQPQKYMICEKFNSLAITVLEIQPSDRQTAKS